MLVGYFIAQQLKKKYFGIPKYFGRKTVTELFIFNRPSQGWISYDDNKDKIKILDWDQGVVSLFLWTDITLGTEIHYKSGGHIKRCKIVRILRMDTTPIYDSNNRRIYPRIIVQEYVGKLHEQT